MTPETVQLVEELIIAMERLTSAEIRGDDLTRRRAENDYQSLMQQLQTRAARRRRSTC
ncbi:hypothetical protein [Mangrovicoccus sp. HB161399]|uniref:hypothetical protein n=1 Tax=Mangrovicoccus sp. HB161399 TaxID=2720392 RepID=UPI0015544AF2|nr:hypothetical protein [Mangrovicoccus sp. HB161399]